MDILSQHLEKLVVFEAACRHGTFQSAANELNLTQPSVSRSIQTLEQALNIRLLVKGRKGVQPTDAGQKLLTYAQGILRGAKDVTQILHAKTAGLSGIITVGTYESLAEYLWPDFILELRKSFPFLNLNLKTNAEKDHFRALEDGSVDIVVDAEPKQREGFISWALYTDQFSLFAQRVVSSKRKNEGEGVSRPFIYVPHASDQTGKSLRVIIDHQWSGLFKEEIQLDSFSTVLRFVMKGVGIGVLPIRLAKQELINSNIEVFKPKGHKGVFNFGEHRICATVLDKRRDDVRLKSLVELLRKFIKSRNSG
jgi:DNA-binding transcriptional LysR family regulator